MSENIKVCPGYQYVGIHCGLKAGDALDLALLLSSRPAVAAAVFYQKIVFPRPRLFMVADRWLKVTACAQSLINSGNANACTGHQGEIDVLTVAEVLAAALELSSSEIFISSTGVIGEPFPVTTVLKGVEMLVAELEAGAGDMKALKSAARAIMTTDKAPKIVGIEVETSQGPVTLTGIAKGAGMIHPNMATMLGLSSDRC